MAVLALNSIQKTAGVRKRTFDDFGKLRLSYFELAAVAVAGDINSTIELCDLPPGAVRVLPGMSRLKASAWGASRTLDLGHRAYAKADYANGGVDEAENETAFIAARDVSAATDAVFSTTQLKYDIYSKSGVGIYAKVEGGTIPVGATLSGFIVYVVE